MGKWTDGKNQTDRHTDGRSDRQTHYSNSMGIDKKILFDSNSQDYGTFNVN